MDGKGKPLFSEDELLPLSALQHLMFCARQCALIHVEQVWSENRLTVEGRNLHSRVHEADDESRGDLRIVRGLRLRSLRLGLVGQADVVEYHRQGGEWIPFPVEYKRGRPKPEACDEVQLCAQAMCLEEMTNARIPEGAVFYGQPRRRHPVFFDDRIRTLTESAARRLHELIDRGQTPAALFEKKCESCSLLGVCMPKMAGQTKSAARYLLEMLE